MVRPRGRATLSCMSNYPATAIGALTVDCDDAKAMVQFYTDAFGGRPDPTFPHLDCVRVDGLLLLFRELKGWSRQPGPARTCRCTWRSTSTTYSSRRIDWSRLVQASRQSRIQQTQLWWS